MNTLELEVIKRIKHDDLKAFDLLFTGYYSQLCNYAVDFLKNKQAAEELVSDVFIKIWENRKLLEIKTSFKSYIYKMVQNQCLNFLRDNSTKKKYGRTISMISRILERI